MLSYRVLADAALVVHFAVVLFVVGGLVFIVAGSLRRWRLARSLWFRLAHLVAIAVVVAQAWLGAVCPLTTLEMWLRARAHQSTYAVSFVEHWMQRLLYYELPLWVFTLAYTVFGLAVVAAWWYFPPRWKRDAGVEDG
jgi:hypothetical protein